MRNLPVMTADGEIVGMLSCLDQLGEWLDDLPAAVIAPAVVNDKGGILAVNLRLYRRQPDGPNCQERGMEPYPEGKPGTAGDPDCEECGAEPHPGGEPGTADGPDCESIKVQMSYVHRGRTFARHVVIPRDQFTLANKVLRALADRAYSSLLKDFPEEFSAAAQKR